MRITLIITGLGLGGAENQVVDLAERFSYLGHNVLIIALTGEILVAPKSRDVQVECLSIEKTFLSIWKGYWRARRLLRFFKPDIVHSHMVHANIFSRLLRLTIFFPRLISSAHSSNEGGALRMWAYRLTDVLADLSTNVSQEAVDSFVRQGAVRRGKMIAVQNGIDCQRFKFDAFSRKNVRGEFGIGEYTQVILAVGRLTEAKDYQNLLRAFELLCEVRSDCVLCIAGTGTNQGAFFEQVKQSKLHRVIRLLGQRQDIPALLSGADIFVLSSAWEGLPLVIGEAMACERVVVSTDAGGIREWLGPTGAVVPIRDSTALAMALQSAAALDDEERMNRGRLSRARVVEHYSINSVVSRWLDLYSSVK